MEYFWHPLSSFMQRAVVMCSSVISSLAILTNNKKSVFKELTNEMSVFRVVTNKKRVFTVVTNGKKVRR